MLGHKKKQGCGLARKGDVNTVNAKLKAFLPQSAPPKIWYTTTDHRKLTAVERRRYQLTTLQTRLFPNWPPDQPTT